MSGTAREPLAIVGIGCRMPGDVANPDEFWNLLSEGRSAIREVPPDRWNSDRYYDEDPRIPGKMITRWGGFLAQIDQFDARFFGISPREALRMDPQQRWLLECAWEAMEDGGHSPDRLAASRTGVFVGISSNDYANVQMKGPSDVDVHTNSGSTLSIASGRISYLFDLKGPSISVDTACSSALVAINMACHAVWDGQCDYALAGGVNALLTPDSSIGFSKASMLSPSGQCFAFDSRANGYVRGEGAGMILLKPLNRALQDRDPVYAVVRAAVVNQDGNTSSMTVPGVESQSDMLRVAYTEAGIDPHRVVYMEAHGTGTPVGDPIETRAIGQVIGKGRTGERCLIGSVKTNVGHLESGSGIAGVIKAALILRHGQVPPNLNFKNPNPDIPFDEFHLRVPTELEPLPRENGRPAVVGVNSFGFGGTNAHIVLEEAPAGAVHRASGRNGVVDLHPVEGDHGTLDRGSDEAMLIPLSGRSQAAFEAALDRMADYLEQNPLTNLRDVVHTAGERRGHHDFRAGVVALDPSAAVAKIRRYREEGAAEGVVVGQDPRKSDQPVVFVFTGQGPQWWGMGQEMIRRDSRFREVIEEIATLLQGYTGYDLAEEMLRDEDTSQIGRTDVAQPAIFALQVALADFWRRHGIEASQVIGHSVGEVAAAYWAGVYSLEDAVKIIYHRSRLQERTRGNGRMAAVGVTEKEGRKIVAGLEDKIDIAAVNSPAMITLAGDADVLEPTIDKIDDGSLFIRWLRVDYAFHTHQMDPVRDELLEHIADIQPRESRIPFISTVTGKPLAGPKLDAEYWWSNVRQPVLFGPAIDRLVEAGQELFLELGPHPAMSGSVRQSLAFAGKEGDIVTSLRRNEPDRRNLLQSLADFYVRGFAVEWPAVARHRGGFVALPSYPWQRDRYWLESDDSREYRLADLVHPLLGTRLRGPKPTWECILDSRAFAYLEDHRLRDSMVFPASGYTEMALGAIHALYPGEPYAAEEVEFLKALFFQSGKPIHLRTEVDPDSGEFTIHSSAGGTQPIWELHARGRLQKLSPAAIETADLEALGGSLNEQLDRVEIYDEFLQAGYQFGPMFQEIASLRRNPGESLGRIEVPDELLPKLHRYQMQPASLDACFQCVKGAQVIDDGRQPEDCFYLPVAIRRIRIFERQPQGAIYSHATLLVDDGEQVAADIEIFDEAHRRIGEISGFRCQRVDQGEKSGEENIDRLLYQFSWEPAPLGADSAAVLTRDFPALTSLTRTLQESLPDIQERYNLHSYTGEFLPKLETWAFDYVVDALDQLGWNWEVGDTVTPSELIGRLGIIEQHARLVHTYFPALAEAGILRRLEGDSWEVTATLPTVRPAAVREELASGYPHFYADVELIGTCGHALPDILRGEADALELMFLGKNAIKLAQFYKDAPDFLSFNEIIENAVEELVATLPENGTLRVIEVGAGTGSLTSKVLPVLPARRSEFVFTDISPAFGAQARGRFGEFGFVDYKTLDISRDVEAQGYEKGAFHLVLATNVLHATPHLNETLANIRDLLAPGGVLLFVDATKPRRSLDLVFGLLKGWWIFEDTDIRPDYPLLPRQRWEELLLESGFDEVASMINTVEEEAASQALVLARKPTEAEAEDTAGESQRIHGRWIVIGDADEETSAFTEAFAEAGAAVCRVLPGETFAGSVEEGFTAAIDNPGEMRRIVDAIIADGDAASALSGFVFLPGLQLAAAETATAEAIDALQSRNSLAALAIAQALVDREWENPPRVYFATRNAQGVLAEDRLDGLAVTPLFGFLRVANNEHAEFRWTAVDFDSDETDTVVAQLIDEIADDSEELEVAYRGNDRQTHRLHRVSRAELPVIKRDSDESGERMPFRLEIPTPGILTKLTLNETLRRTPADEEVEIAVAAAGLNFRDVMKAMGIYPGDSPDLLWFGDECSGRVVRCGRKVTRFRPGDAVVAIAPYCFRSYATVNEAMVIPKPDDFSFEEAATLPIVFLTAHYALHELARIQPGEKVLIHSAAGGVGQAAVQVARAAGAEIFGTASQPKQDFLRELGVEHVFDSRTLDFADEIMEVTGGTGVDIVLNSLAGDFIPKSFGILAPYGRFLEIGKIDIYSNTKIGLSPFRNNISYFAIDLAQSLNERPRQIAGIFHQLAEDFAEGKYKPLHNKVFPVSEASEAFRYMAQGKHIGKVVLSFDEESIPVGPPTDPDALFKPDATYLVTGGLGGFGFEMARWMAQHGARHLVLVSRRGEAAPGAPEALEELRGFGAEPVAMAADMTREADVRGVIEAIARDLPPLRGVFHAAMVLDDGFVHQLDRDRFRNVLAPKVLGSWHLHQLTGDAQLDYFVLFSSISAVVGGAGQGNYAAANLFLDALAHYRRRRGLAALSINWGALAGAGVVARDDKLNKYLENLGLRATPTDEALEVFEKLIAAHPVQVAVAEIDWSTLTKRNAATFSAPTYAPVARSTTEESGGADSGAFRQRLMAAGEGDRMPLLVDFIAEQVAGVFGTTAEKVDRKTPLTQIGLDSLMAIELMNRLESSLGIKMPMGQVLQGPTIEQLAEPVFELVANLGDEIPGAAGAASVDGRGDLERAPEDWIDFPLTAGQRALWFLNRLAPESSAYNLVFSSKISPAVEIPVMEKAFALLFERHPMLDVTFRSVDGEPVQRVRENWTIDFREHDARSLDDTELKRRLVEHGNRPFNLETGPVIRLELFRTADDAHVTLLAMHHIVSDAWSVVVLLNDLIEAYFSLRAGKEPELKPIGHRYQDFVLWHQKFMASTEADKMRDYWVDQVDGAPLALDLPTDFPRPAVQTFNGATYGFTLDEDLTAEILEFTSSRNVTLFTTMLAAYQVLLHRYCDQDDLLVGSPFAGRNRQEFHDLVGYFINPVPIRSQVSGDPPFSDYLREVSKSVVGALENQDYPLANLVDELKAPRDPSRSPVFQVSFSMERIPGVDEQGIAVFLIGQGGHNFQVADISVESIDLNLRMAQFEITLVVEEAGGNLYGCWQYNSDLFTPDTIAYLNDLYATVLRKVIANPDYRISEIPLVDEDRAGKMALDWNRTEREYERDRTLHGLFLDRARDQPDKTAIVTAEGKVTYEALAQKAAGIARSLRKHGIGTDAPVGIYLDRTADMLAATLGVQMAGGCYVPLDPAFPRKRLEEMLEDAAPAVILSQASLAAGLPESGGDVIDVAECLPTTDLSGLDDTAGESLAYIIYTSGSTGRPKGVEIPHRAVVNFLRSMQQEPGYSAGDTLLAVTTLSFDISVLELYLPLLTGGTVVIASRAEAGDGRRLAHLMADHGVTVMQATPATWQLLLDSGWEGKSDLRILCGGEALPRALADELLDCGQELWNLYGPTETTIWSTIEQVASGDDAISIGRPIANTTAFVLDDHDRPQAPGLAGDLYIGGDGLARGYHGRSDLTAERFVSKSVAGRSHRLYWTGDKARYRTDGRIDYLGRGDGQIKLRGYRIELGDIESHLLAHPHVLQAAVVKRDDLPGGAGLAAYVVPASGNGTSAELASQLRAWLSDRLPDYMRPAAFTVIPAMPMTPNNKVDRRRLPAPAIDRDALGEEFIAPRTPSERVLADILRKAFDSPDIGIRDNFFELGGDSLLAVQILAEISSAFNRDVAVHVFLRNPSIESLAAYLDTHPADADDGGRTRGEDGIDIEHLELAFISPERGPESESVGTLDAAALAYIPDSLMPLTGLSKDAVARDWLGNQPVLSNVYRTPFGRTGVIMLPRTGADLYKDRAGLERLTLRALETAARYGARTISLTGLIPSATEYGQRINQWVNGREDLPVLTTGHAATTATVVLNIEALLRTAERSLGDEDVAILGLGSIGRATLELMLEALPHPQKLVLVDLYHKGDELRSIAGKLRTRFGFRGEVEIEATRGRMPESVYQAGLIVGATNVPGVLDIRRIGSGTLIVDDSFPPCFHAIDGMRRIDEAGDILFTTGGLLRFPGVVEETVFLPEGSEELIEQRGLGRMLAILGRDPREMTGCILSGLLVGRETGIRPTLGPVRVEDSVAHLQYLKSNQLAAARLQVENFFIPDERVEAFRDQGFAPQAGALRV